MAVDTKSKEMNPHPLFLATTRGGKHQIKVFPGNKSGLYDIRLYTSGRETGASTGHDLHQMQDWVRRTIRDAKEIDGINYRITTDDVGIQARDGFGTRKLKSKLLR